MKYSKKESYQEIKINLKKEENGSELLDYLEKAARDLGMYTEKTNIAGKYCGNPYIRNGECVSISFFSPLSKILHLYIAQFSVRVNTNQSYTSLNVIDEPIASLKKVKRLSQKLESKMEEILG